MARAVSHYFLGAYNESFHALVAEITYVITDHVMTPDAVRMVTKDLKNKIEPGRERNIRAKKSILES
jgi:hypothetical protein